MTEIEAIYHDGKLELKTPLPLTEGQSVRVIVVTEEAVSVADRSKAMELAAGSWLKLQSTENSSQPHTDVDATALDAEWDELFAEIETGSSKVSEAEIAADVESAVRATRQRNGG